MREKMIPLVTMLLTGAVTGILCIWKQYDTLYSLKALLGVLIGFYILGLIARHLYRKVTAEKPVPPTEEEENGEGSELLTQEGSQTE